MTKHNDTRGIQDLPDEDEAFFHQSRKEIKAKAALYQPLRETLELLHKAQLLTRLSTAARYGDAYETLQLLEQQQEATVNVADENGHTALHFAVMASCLEGGTKPDYVNTVKVLLVKGADATLKNNFGVTALQIAEHSGHNELAEILRNPQKILAEKEDAGQLFADLTLQNAAAFEVEVLLQRATRRLKSVERQAVSPVGNVLQNAKEEVLLAQEVQARLTEQQQELQGLEETIARLEEEKQAPLPNEVRFSGETQQDTDFAVNMTEKVLKTPQQEEQAFEQALEEQATLLVENALQRALRSLTEERAEEQALQVLQVLDKEAESQQPTSINTNSEAIEKQRQQGKTKRQSSSVDLGYHFRRIAIVFLSALAGILSLGLLLLRRPQHNGVDKKELFQDEETCQSSTTGLRLFHRLEMERKLLSFGDNSFSRWCGPTRQELLHANVEEEKLPQANEYFGCKPH